MCEDGAQGSAGPARQPAEPPRPPAVPLTDTRGDTQGGHQELRDRASRGARALRLLSSRPEMC